MSLSTFNFKRIFYLIVFLTIFIFSALCVLIECYIQMHTSRTEFVSSISASKAKHLQLMNSANTEDMFFIGSSRTMYLINSDYFVNAGLKVYNFGIDAHTLSSYSYMLAKAITYKPKYIVLSIDVNELYSPLNDNSDIHYVDIKAYINTHQPQAFINNAYSYYMGSFNLIRNQWPLVYMRAAEIYDSLIQKTALPILTKKILGSCVPFEEQLFHAETVIRCTDGDGIILGGDAVLPISYPIYLTTLNRGTISFIKYLISQISGQGITPMIVFPPSSYHYVYNMNIIHSVLQVPIFDFTNFAIPQADWVDAQHFNVDGRQLYSEALAKEVLHELHD